MPHLISFIKFSKPAFSFPRLHIDKKNPGERLSAIVKKKITLLSD